LIYHGNGGHLLLAGLPQVRGRVIADMERASARRWTGKLDREQAIAHPAGGQRRASGQSVYGVNWTI
jgi:hypothetical protein